MPLNITSETPRKDRTLANIIISVPAPYSEGHPLTEGEAAQLNQVLAENVGNNLRKKLEQGFEIKAPADGIQGEYRPFTKEEAQKLVDDYMSVYEPGVRQSSGVTRAPVDPLEREIHAMAKGQVVEFLKQQGLKQKDLEDGALDRMIAAVTEQQRATLEKQAKAVLKARTSAKSEDGLMSALAAFMPAGGAPSEPTDAEQEAAVEGEEA